MVQVQIAVRVKASLPRVLKPLLLWLEDQYTAGEAKDEAFMIKCRTPYIAAEILRLHGLLDDHSVSIQKPSPHPQAFHFGQ